MDITETAGEKVVLGTIPTAVNKWIFTETYVKILGVYLLPFRLYKDLSISNKKSSKVYGLNSFI